MNAKLILEDGTIFQGEARGYKSSTSGEVVFTTGMVGYDLSLTDPSFRGQILTFTYPLIGNWGVPPKKFWESEKIHTKGIIIGDLTDKPDHWQSEKTLEQWLIENKVPTIVNIDTRALTQKLRDHGVMLGKIVVDGKDIEFDDPNRRNLVAEVSLAKVRVHNPNGKGPKIALLNCGAKRNIVNCLTKRGATVYELPWNYDPFANNLKFDGLVISNGPGDPKMATDTINIIRKALDKKLPTFGICLGNQLLALAAGGDTYKLKFGHRSQNQPTLQVGTKRCYITTQNHGYAVNEKKLPKGFKPWFINANDNTNEGIIHEKLPFFSVQFHPEAAPGPTDTEFLFDFFLNKVKKNK
ncbi:MAG: glutamine-hydrolyzing carbamoyl-phosphate synthase small subunit [Patescibacteria group bacterium]